MPETGLTIQERIQLLTLAAEVRTGFEGPEEVIKTYNLFVKTVTQPADQDEQAKS